MEDLYPTLYLTIAQATAHCDKPQNYTRLFTGPLNALIRMFRELKDLPSGATRNIVD